MSRRNIEAEFLPSAERNDIGVMVYGPLAHGLLSGTMTRETTFPAGHRRGTSAHFKGDRLARGPQVVDRLKQYAPARETTPPQPAAPRTLSNPAAARRTGVARHPPPH